MPLSIRDEETTRLVRQLAARKGIGLTEAVRTAVKNELAQIQDRQLPSEIFAKLRQQVAAKGGDLSKADKAFFDSLNDE